MSVFDHLYFGPSWDFSYNDTLTNDVEIVAQLKRQVMRDHAFIQKMACG
jgi:hypothetical protein